MPGQLTGTEIFAPWDQLKATYRGREQVHGPPLNITDVKRLSLMMRRCVNSKSQRQVFTKVPSTLSASSGVKKAHFRSRFGQYLRSPSLMDLALCARKPHNLCTTEMTGQLASTETRNYQAWLALQHVFCIVGYKN
jgi:Complex I intermediate-associated protein 30 (CIA30)